LPQRCRLMEEPRLDLPVSSCACVWCYYFPLWPVQRGVRPALSLCELCPLRKPPRSQSDPTP
jgi:hypothetical protein